MVYTKAMSTRTRICVCLAWLVLFGVCSTRGQTIMQPCEIEAINACMEPFRSGYAQGGAQDKVCEGYERSVLCTAERCQGETLNLFRYVLGEHDLMNMKLSECPVRDDYSDRQQSLRELDERYKYGGYIGDDKPSDCAKATHNNCMAKLSNPDEPNMCIKLHEFIQCYIEARSVCDSSIIRDFANLCETHGLQLLLTLENTPGIVSCENT